MAQQQLILLSDLHIGLRKRESELTRMVVEKVAKAYFGVPVLITGDITDSGLAGQFREAREILDDLAVTNPILMVPGNHDYAWKGNVLHPKGWENWVTYLGCPLGWNRPAPPYWTGPSEAPGGVEGLGVWQDGPIVYFGIDSGDPEDKQFSARGYISKALATELKNALIAHRGKTRVAFLHHHPFTGGLRHIFTALNGAGLLMDALRNNCEVLLFGHEHEYGLWWQTEGVPLIVSSHKTSEPISGNCCAITIIDIDHPGTDSVGFSHRIEMV